jgi:hypothetical protein
MKELTKVYNLPHNERALLINKANTGEELAYTHQVVMEDIKLVDTNANGSGSFIDWCDKLNGVYDVVLPYNNIVSNTGEFHNDLATKTDLVVTFEPEPHVNATDYIYMNRFAHSDRVKDTEGVVLRNFIEKSVIKVRRRIETDIFATTQVANSGIFALPTFNGIQSATIDLTSPNTVLTQLSMATSSGYFDTGFYNQVALVMNPKDAITLQTLILPNGGGYVFGDCAAHPIVDGACLGGYTVFVNSSIPSGTAYAVAKGAYTLVGDVDSGERIERLQIINNIDSIELVQVVGGVVTNPLGVCKLTLTLPA